MQKFRLILVIFLTLLPIVSWGIEVGQPCNPNNKPCPKDLVCSEQIIPDLGKTHSCRLPCKSNQDCLALTAAEDIPCVKKFLDGATNCECRPGAVFHRCIKNTCDIPMVFQDYGKPLCL